MIKLLHIEDDDGDAKIVRRQLIVECHDHQYVIDRAKTIYEAINKLKENAYNVVLLDLSLGDMHSLTNVNYIKTQAPNVPIVVLSGYSDTRLALESIRYGAQEYIIKGSVDSHALDLAILSSIERKLYEISLLKLAHHDELTGIPNRRMFLEYMQRILIRAKRWALEEALLFMDVNGFKEINDQFGHDLGDLLLQEVVVRLKETLRSTDMLARFGGDEFVIHPDNQSSKKLKDCEEIANKITSAFKDPLLFNETKIQTSFSIGIALYPKNGLDLDTLLHQADQAMYNAKKSNQAFCFA